MALDRVPERINFRADDEIREGVKLMSERLGTNNVSEIFRTTFMIGVDRARTAEESVLRRARTEGLLAGLGQLTKRVELAVRDLVREVSGATSGSGQEVARGEGEETSPSVYPDAG